MLNWKSRILLGLIVAVVVVLTPTEAQARSGSVDPGCWECYQDIIWGQSHTDCVVPVADGNGTDNCHIVCNGTTGRGGAASCVCWPDGYWCMYIEVKPTN
jgi:hypothetical protein